LLNPDQPLRASLIPQAGIIRIKIALLTLPDEECAIMLSDLAAQGDNVQVAVNLLFCLRVARVHGVPFTAYQFQNIVWFEMLLPIK
jgi:hypothetical protein